MKKMSMMMYGIAMFLSVFALSSMERFNKKQVLLGAYSHQGRRTNQEDAWVLSVLDRNNKESVYALGVFDGHAGGEVSYMLSKEFLPHIDACMLDGHLVKNAMKAACVICHEKTKTEALQCQGSTLLSVCFDPADNSMHILWSGDSCAYFGNATTFFVTNQHRPTDTAEKERITQAEGRVDDRGRVEGVLGVSCSIGDWFFKNQKPGLVLSTFDYCTYACNDSYNYVVAVSDGFSDAVSPEEFGQVFADACFLSKSKFNKKYPLTDGIVMSDSSAESDSDEESNSSAESATDGEVDSSGGAGSGLTSYSSSGADESNDSPQDEESELSACDARDERIDRLAKRLVRIALSKKTQDNVTAAILWCGDVSCATGLRKSNFDNVDLDLALRALNKVDGSQSGDDSSQQQHRELCTPRFGGDDRVMNKKGKPSQSDNTHDVETVVSTETSTHDDTSRTSSWWSCITEHKHSIFGGALLVALLAYYYNHVNV